mmetsp:Transcript_99388/g.265762  ORF Transcript_99388/g.265762 Transcript_99388/m.265762 type:complete len:141 (-) Transcript_99388:25-447(-)
MPVLHPDLPVKPLPAHGTWCTDRNLVFTCEGKHCEFFRHRSWHDMCRIDEPGGGAVVCAKGGRDTVPRCVECDVSVPGRYTIGCNQWDRDGNIGEASADIAADTLPTCSFDHPKTPFFSCLPLALLVSVEPVRRAGADFL